MKHDLPPLILANGMKLPAELAEVAVDADRTENKRWRVVFGCAEEMGITDRSRIPRLSFHQAGGRALLAGMLFRDAPPGSRAGERIVDYFVNSLCPELGLSVGETSVIRKPVMALVLARCGFLAIESDEKATAGLLPARTGDRSPALHFISGNRQSLDDPKYSSYYSVVANRELPFLYPLKNPSRPVDIHTSFRQG